jgi:hypothetical protein
VTPNDIQTISERLECVTYLSVCIVVLVDISECGDSWS